MAYIKVLAVFVAFIAVSQAFVIPQTDDDGTVIRDNILDQKFAFLEHFLKQYNVDVAAIKERIKTSAERHSVAKRAISANAEDSTAIRDQILDEKFAFLQTLLQQFNVDVEAIKARIKASTQRHTIAKRDVLEDIENIVVPSVPQSDDATDVIGGILDGIYSAINVALKSFADGFLAGLNSSTNGVLSDSLINLQAFLYGLIDNLFPTTSTTYMSQIYQTV